MTKRFGFTLAEVLITLAIIGIVAAMTIPTLVANYQQKSWDTASSVFEKKLSEALKVMNTQQTLAGLRTTENFVNELGKHFKITKVCQKDELISCFSNKVFWGSEGTEVEINTLSTSKDFGQDEWDTNILGLQFANGTTGLVAYNPTESCKQDPYSNRITGTGCLALLYDTSGYRSPNTSSKDLRSINVMKLGSKVGCAFELDGACWSAGFVPTPLTYVECNELSAQLNIGCVDPVSYNLVDENYWAGAVKNCNEQGGRLPTESELLKLAEELYPNATVFNEEDSVGVFCPDEIACWDEDKVVSYGFNVNVTEIGDDLTNNVIWSSEFYHPDEYSYLYPKGLMLGSEGAGFGTNAIVIPHGARCIFE